MAFGLDVILNKRRREVWKRAFRMWQKRPHEVAPIDATEKECASCGTKFQGNYCPRCGQVASVGRFSFKKAFLLFLDVWGIGNRGMFRSIRDLMLRPGYMIRDYVSGHQSAYFPPFKMFFLLTTFSLLLSHGIDLGIKSQQPQPNPTETVVEDDSPTIRVDGEKIHDSRTRNIQQFFLHVEQIRKKYPAVFGFLALLFMATPLYLFMRRSPAIPDLRYSEHIVALVYTSNMYSIYTMIGSVMPFSSLASAVDLLALVMIFVSLHQFSGFTKRKLLLYFLLTILISLAILVAIIFAVIYLIGTYNP